MNADTTIAIAARNAAATIARAVRSARAADCPILLVDHASSDGTADIAREAAEGQVAVVCAPSDCSLGAVRNRAVESIDTTYGIWLDADDELLAGRCCRLVGRLREEGADVGYDEIELRDGATGALLRHLTFPECLRDSQDMIRNFERNFVPGPGVPAFRTSFARRVGYDRALHGAEDYDFLLRAIAAGGRFSLVHESLYRQFAYPNSQSRDTANQRRMCRMALMKHEPLWLEGRLRDAGVEGWERTWAMVSFLVFREQYAAALRLIEATAVPARGGAGSLDHGDSEADAHWRLYFQRGTLALAIGQADEAVDWLMRAQAVRDTPEGVNNLGVAVARCGRRAEAVRLWEQAMLIYPEYHDPAENLRSPEPTQVTMLPLRTHATRSRYL